MIKFIFPLNNRAFIFCSSTTYHLLPITYHLSPITYYLSPIIYYISPIAYHLSPLQSPGAKCPYQRMCGSPHRPGPLGGQPNEGWPNPAYIGQTQTNPAFLVRQNLLTDQRVDPFCLTRSQTNGCQRLRRLNYLLSIMLNSPVSNRLKCVLSTRLNNL